MGFFIAAGKTALGKMIIAYLMANKININLDHVLTFKQVWWSI